jgi:hypothetical protein
VPADPSVGREANESNIFPEPGRRRPDGKPEESAPGGSSGVSWHFARMLPGGAYCLFECSLLFADTLIANLYRL